MPTSRSDAFAASYPDGWTPQVGEVVWVRLMRGTLSTLVSRGTVVSPTLLPDMVSVQLRFGLREVTEQVLVEDLRPVEE